MLDQNVEIFDKQLGKGRKVAKIDDEIKISYENRLESNFVVASATAEQLKLGAASFVGWNIGIIGMKKGGERQIICPPKVAYGENGFSPFVPPNSTIISTVKLQDFVKK